MFERKSVPVRYTGRNRWHFSCWYRRPKTTGNKRKLQLVEDFEPKPRPSQHFDNLPNAWDDYPACRQRTWKVFGKKARQWSNR